MPRITQRTNCVTDLFSDENYSTFSKLVIVYINWLLLACYRGNVKLLLFKKQGELALTV
jgi:hypothetical protein